MTPEEFRKAGHRIIDRIADYRPNVAALPVMARTAPGEVRDALPAVPPEEPEGFDAILADLERVILPGLSHWQHPHFYGYFPSNGELSSVLGDSFDGRVGAAAFSPARGAYGAAPASTTTPAAARELVGVKDAPQRGLQLLRGLGKSGSGEKDRQKNSHHVMAFIAGAAGKRRQAAIQRRYW